MGLSKKQSERISSILIQSLRNKLSNYKPEPASMPFHTRLLGKDRMALFSFIHSLNTNFGTSIFEPVALELASGKFKVVKSHCNAGKLMSEKAQYVIQGIIDDLVAAYVNPDKDEEVKKIRNVCQVPELRNVKLTQVDIWLESDDGELFLFDLKTAKPNKGAFKEFKRTLLEWTACILAENPHAKVNTLIAIPYNPYEPKPYYRWTLAGMLDLKKELKVGAEFWDFLAGEGTYFDLLEIFEQVGITLRPEIDEYFGKYQLNS